ncbi:MAG TPA: hydantoinase/oxoprolinase family protein [bacterium]|nr:hydantoinase/oxoprolinase family protein [bacterium]
MILGIDTGGTYTDSVILDEGKVFSKGKALTTHYDLTKGIRESIDALDKNLFPKVSAVILSTTLATNTIVEMRRLERVKEVLIGYDRDFFLKNISNIPEWLEFEFVSGSIDVTGEEVLPLDLERIKSLEVGDYPLAISGYMSPINPKYEMMAKDILKSKSRYPVVCGSELSGELNSIKRAITTGLNASLIPVISSFIRDVKRVLAEEGIKARILIVNADGSITDVEDAMEKPIKTVLSGPASSTIGGLFLSGIDNGIIVDMGGTTTDISLVQGSAPLISSEGARVGEWELLLPSLKMRTVGLGGDSRIHLLKNSIEIGPARAIPVSVLGKTFPEIKKKLKKTHNSSLVPPNEFIVKLREPSFELNSIERKLMGSLNGEPLSMEEATKICNLSHPYILDSAIKRLEEMGIIIRSGLTPTDILLYLGECEMGDPSISSIALSAFSKDKEFPQFIKKLIIKKIATEILRYLFFLDYKDERIDGLLGNLINDSLDRRFNLIETKIKLPFPIVGIGAPVKSFIYEVAEMLHTSAIVPEHYEVANAAGAGWGRVIRSIVLEIMPIVSSAMIKGYKIRGLDRKFNEYEKAKNFAINYGSELIESQLKKLTGDDGEIKTEVIFNDSDETALKKVQVIGMGKIQ